MNEKQIKEAMRLADEIADYAWKEGLSDGAYSNAKQDRECRAESRAELEAYLRTIGEPAGYSLPAGSMGEKKWAQLPKDCKPIGLVFQRIDAKTGAITEAGRVTWADWLAYPEADEPESVNAELLEALKSAKDRCDKAARRVRIEWNIGGTSGHGKWFDRSNRSALMVQCLEMSIKHGVGSHRIVDEDQSGEAGYEND